MFNVALELRAEERGAYLNDACAGDPALRQRVEELLRASGESCACLEEPGAVSSGAGGAGRPTPVPAEKPGDRIGRYKLLQQIGEGGCGVVYMAEQEEPVHRRVAIKVIKLGMDTKNVIARFEAERQALALMDHPNIAKVLDAGATDTGRPYFVMELVRGIKITDHCDQNNLSTRERLDLFMQVCRAIQHAHQKGIIHRDIKPSNILVTMDDRAPVPKVIDFGIAKATQGKLTDRTLFTAFEQFIGTPAYMSPEQAEMRVQDIDTRSDIYSLGVLLYELLTGQTPFDAKKLLQAGLDEIRRIIREEEPARPSTRLSTMLDADLTEIAKRRKAEPPRLIHLLRGDLDWIVMKALEKDRGRRYETANGLAMDIQRHMENEPVQARPPSVGYRLQKSWQRNKTAFTVAILIAAVLVVATCVSAWQAVRANREFRRALQAESLANQRLADSEAISKFLIEVFRSPSPLRDGRTITVAETLSNATQRLATELTNQPARRAKLQSAIAQSYWDLGLHHEAVPLQEKVRDYYLAAAGPESPDTLAAASALATLYLEVGRWDEALKLFEQVLPLEEKVNGPEDPATLLTMSNLAFIYDDLGRQAEALKLREQVLALTRKSNGPGHPDTLEAMRNLAISYSEAGRHDEALKLLEQAVELFKKVLGAEHPSTLKTMGDLALVYYQVGRPDDALKLGEEVLALKRKVLGPEHPDTLDSTANVAFFTYAAGHRDEALKLFEQALALYLKVLGPKHPDTLQLTSDLANIYEEVGRWDAALKLLDQTPIRQWVQAKNSWDAALKLLDQTLTQDRQALGSQDPITLQTMNDLAWLQAASPAAETRNGTNAVLLAEEAVAGTQRKNPGFLDTLAAAYAESQQFDKAVAVEQEAIGLLKSEPDKNDYSSHLKLYQANQPCRIKLDP
ncbi:MAG: serine/threonine-protein kinase [Verrucomicrobiota bacterium]